MWGCRSCYDLYPDGVRGENDCPLCTVTLDYIGDGTMDFNNATDADFTDISSEQWREYKFAGTIIRIESPLRLNVSRSGGHRIFDAAGDSHYIPPTWVHLRWRARAGEPHFVK